MYASETKGAWIGAIVFVLGLVIPICGTIIFGNK